MPVTTIVGIGELPIGKHPELGSMELHAESAAAAIEDAGADWGRIDGLITCGSFVDPYPRHALATAEYLGISQQLTVCHEMGLGGASASAGVVQAHQWITTGLCRSVLLIGADDQATGLTRDAAVAMYSSFRHPEFEGPFGLSNPAAYALLAARHQAEHGLEDEDRARVAVAIREWAELNPDASYKTPLEVAEVLGSKLIASPLHMLECSSFADGGAALLIEADRPGVRLRGFGMGFTHDHVIQAPSLTSSGSEISGRRAFEMAGVKPADISVAELYDSYTIAVITQLEDLGFCRPGEGGEFVRERGIGPGGELPVATHGGLLSHGHPGAPGGIYHLTEAVRQLRGECGERQVDDVDLALVHGEGGILSANCTLILERTGGDGD